MLISAQGEAIALPKFFIGEHAGGSTVTPWWGGMADADYADGCRCRIAVAGYPQRRSA